MTLVGWDSIYQPRSHGGLGLRYMRDQNTFFFYEDWVNLVSKDSALWYLWVPTVGPLIMQIHALDNLNLDCPLSEMVTPDGTWNLDLLSVWLSKDVVRQIVSIPPPHPSSESDKGIGYNNSCSLCEHETEDTHHVLWDCSATKKTKNLEVVRALQGSVTMDSGIQCSGGSKGLRELKDSGGLDMFRGRLI
ncbi:hypothetical protein Godav_020682 [Gossypium davidsonii]|uniref:Reverse transcriptase zinc-binding domain-containing protein n=1 Tax=Gossypium davidsonii TaxID=34287 RepID=A0A7J8R3Q8_GOSDV|nr:hypothetical protein [Gossypium davidsonii]